ncbi:hypothetical protein D3C71_2065130 [compost metagenome]
MLPMFYLSHGHSEKPQRYILILWNAAVWIGAGSSLLSLPAWMQILAFVCLAAALFIYCLQIQLVSRKKH